MSHGLYFALGGVFVLLFVLERMFPARREPFDPGWFVRALTINVVQLGIMLALALALNPMLAPHALYSAADWPPALGGLAAAIIGSFIQYGWHRAAHASDFLWRVFHQMHHSPSRIDVLTTNYSHPLDYLVNTAIHAFSAVVVLGLDADAIAWSVFIYGANNYFAHCNLRSPRWLGYVLQRPEMHRLHHRFEHHRQNYGFPMWDMLFGTWENPPTHGDYTCGFGGDREKQVAKMLLGKDVNK